MVYVVSGELGLTQAVNEIPSYERKEGHVAVFAKYVLL